MECDNSEIVTKRDLADFFGALPDEKEHDFEKKIVALAVKVNRNVTMKNYLDANQLLIWADEILYASDAGNDDKVRFAAFCFCVERCLRLKNGVEAKKYLDKNERTFPREKHPMYLHLVLLYQLHENKFDNPQIIIQEAINNCERMPYNAGALHLAGALTAAIFERANLTGEKIDISLLNSAEDKVARAIQLDPNFPRYYCTKGRLLALKENYDAALQCMNIAINMEDSSAEDYAMRIDEFRSYESVIENRWREKKLSDSIAYMDKKLVGVSERYNKIERDTNNALSKNVEFISLFAALISVTVGSVSVVSNASSVSFVGTAGVILVLMGSLLCVYSGLTNILHGMGKPVKGRFICSLLLGMCLSVTGIVLCFLSS